MKSMHISALILSVMLPLFASASELDKPWDRRDPTLPVREAATDDWLKSWQPGYTVNAHSKFRFEGDLKIKKNGQPVSWFDYRKYTGQRLHANYDGAAIAQTTCLQEEPYLKLTRTYISVVVNRTLSVSVHPQNEMIRELIKQFSEDGSIGELLRKNQWVLNTLKLYPKTAPYILGAESIGSIIKVHA